MNNKAKLDPSDGDYNPCVPSLKTNLNDRSQDQIRLLEQARMVAARLEKLSPDSTWARRSSGARGSLLKLIEHLDDRRHPGKLTAEEVKHLEFLVGWGFVLLARGAREKF